MRAGLDTKSNLSRHGLSEDSQRVALLRHMMVSREADTREDILFRQGRGQFHVSSRGHESLASLERHMQPGDWIFSHYRDRALLLARGVPLQEMALGYFAKAKSSSGGRQMVNHFSDASLNIMSSATPTGLLSLPAAGLAWGLQRLGSNDVVFSCIGEASTRQGEFLEAVAFSIQERLPIIFIVEDNGYGISTPTETLTPLGLDLISSKFIELIDGRDAVHLGRAMQLVVASVREGHGPRIAWIKLDRLSAHTASDDHTKYRLHEDLSEMKTRDPVLLMQNRLLQEGAITEDELTVIQEEIRSEVKEIYLAAEREASPDPAQASMHVFSEIAPAAKHVAIPVSATQAHEEWTMADAFNTTLDRLLRDKSNVLMFGEDIEDPKGGVFGLTRGLSERYKGRVINSPLAEATIAGLASGLSVAGFMPIFELQFVDFIGPAFNQLVNQIATLRWRSAGKYKSPMIIYAPCGAFVGGGPWHSQTNESWLAHAPGLKVYMPSNANDAAQMLYSAAYGNDPVIMLLPKNQFQKRFKRETEPRLHVERARILRQGSQATMVAWGNCVELALEAAAKLDIQGIGTDVLDMCSISPCDWKAIHASVQKTGRLIVIQEDNKTCSFGQAIISEACTNKAVWESLYAPPQLISREDVHIGFSRVLEKAVLPRIDQILRGVNISLGRSNG